MVVRITNAALGFSSYIDYLAIRGILALWLQPLVFIILEGGYLAWRTITFFNWSDGYKVLVGISIKLI